MRRQFIQIKDKADVSLDELKLSTRVRNILSAAGYHTLGDLNGHTLKEVSSLHVMGEKSLKELKTALADLLSQNF